MANKAQRKLNRFIRKFNKNLANDAFLGLNRFSLKQVARVGIEEYEQHYLIELHDNLSGDKETIIVNNYNFDRELFWKMNGFIIGFRQKEKW